MSNFDDLDLDLDLDSGDLTIDSISEGEFDKGFKLEKDSIVSFIDDDVIATDDVILSLDSSGFKGLEMQKDEESVRLLEQGFFSDEVEIDDVDLGLGEGEEEPKYEVALTPAQTALQLYRPHEDESFIIETTNKEIHNAIYDVGQYERNANKRLREYLDSPMFNILPKNAEFDSAAFSKQQDFRSMIIADFHNHRSVPEVYTKDHIVDKVLTAYEVENFIPELDDEMRETIRQLIYSFVLFANTTFDEAQRLTELAEYKEFPKTLTCPEVVGNFTYVCKCGEEYPMPEGRPTLTFLIREVNKSPVVQLMNHQIECAKCNHYLVLPSPLASLLTDRVQEYVKTIRATYENMRIYRPKLDILREMIPSDVQDLFQLESSHTIQATAITTSQTASAEFRGYQKLINMWMNSVVSEHEIKEVEYKFKDAPEVSDLVKRASNIEFGFVVDLYAYQFTKTILHYLEGFSCFALTYERKAFYEYCSLENYRKEAFPVDYAKKWITENAPFIASLNNLYTGDTSIKDLGIMPEYAEAINHVVLLHLLSKPELINNRSILGRWLSNPSSVSKDLKKVYDLLNIKPKMELAKSPRDIVNTTEVKDTNCWRDTYSILKHIVYPRRFQGVQEPLKSLSVSAGRKTAEEFYGQEIPERLIIRPALMFEEFKQAFKEYGHLLFDGVIIDQVRLNLAKGIELLRKTNRLDKVFKTSEYSVNSVNNILTGTKDEEVDEAKLLLEMVLKNGELPEDLALIRDEHGAQGFIDNFETYKDRLLEDEKFMEKYGEVIRCYL